jgi:membrane associated rhomboid family serine protease
VATGLFGGRVWELLTFQFLHGGIGHLAVNMIGLYVFGPWLERWWGSRRFTVYYLLCGMAGALFFALLWWLGMFPDTGPYTPLVGASAGLYGILVGVAVIAPDLRVMLVFPPIELSMRQLALAVLAIAVLAVLTGVGGNAGGEAGHLGGAIVGYLLIQRPHWLAWAARRRPEVEIIRPRAFGGPGRDAPTDAGLAEEVDRILEKISAHGMHSLTPGERATLEKVSRSRNFPP